MDVMRDLGLVMTGEGKEYPRSGLRNLNNLKKDELLALGTKYQGRTGYARTVEEVHQQAIAQAREYGIAEYEYQKSQDNPLPVYIFAVTQILNRCISEQVLLT